jgi:lysophospholipase L1-like esterase
MLKCRYLSLFIASVFLNSNIHGAVSNPKWNFLFGGTAKDAQTITVNTSTPYSEKLGYGFESSSEVKFVTRSSSTSAASHFITSDKPFFFSVKAPEGNYKVKVLLGDSEGESVTTIKSELRRLSVERLHTNTGETTSAEFIVNVRNVHISDTLDVKLKPREKTSEVWNWDDKLTFEFNGPRPCVVAIEITPVSTVPTIYLAGDSTVCDQPLEPYASWGQMLPRFFKPTLAIANHAESGESLRSFIGERRLKKLETLFKAGDYLFIQMGHNDQKEKGSDVGAFTTYKKSLETFVAVARLHKVTPILITSMNRRTFDADGHITNSLLDYPEAVRRVAKEQHVVLLDLNLMSKTLYENLGPENTKHLFPFVHGQLEGTHHNNYGSYELARCIVQAIRDNHLPIAKDIIDDIPPFDPAHADSFSRFNFDPSPNATAEKPYGN